MEVRSLWRGDAVDLSEDAVDVAPELLGAVVSVCDAEGEVAIRLTEVEAYEGSADPGSHAYRGPTPRTAPMFAAGGRLYVYLSYGMHWCANLVCGPQGRASAVLLRGGEVVGGVDLARARRPAARRDADLARGPARLAQALGLTGEDSNLVLRRGGRAWVTRPSGPVPVSAIARDGTSVSVSSSSRVSRGPRVGVSGAGGDGETFPWRWWLTGDPTVSAYRPAQVRSRR